MEIKVLSRKTALQFQNTSEAERAAIISITSSEDEYPSFTNDSLSVLLLCFDDVNKGQPNCITDNHAHKIVQFVNTVQKQGCQKLVVHCDAGISRSAGVAAAIMKFITGSDMDIFGVPVYRPNMICYRTVLNAFYDFK
jgi:predicted protein tyrosine phosphatase